MPGLGANPTPPALAALAPKFRAWRRSAGPPPITPNRPLNLDAFLPVVFDQGSSSACGGFTMATLGATNFNMILDYRVQFDPWWPYMLAAHGRDEGVNAWEIGRAIESRGLLPVAEGVQPPADHVAVPRLLDESSWGPEAAIRAEGYTLREAQYVGTSAGNTPAECWELGNAALDYGRPFALAVVLREGFVDAPRGIPGQDGIHIGGHLMPVVGRRNRDNPTGDRREWKVRNSWGPSWGILGDGWIDRSYLTDSPWTDLVIFVSVDAPGEPPCPDGSPVRA